MNFDIKIKQCREYELSELKKRLYSLRRISKESILKAEFNYVESRLFKLNIISTRNKSIRFKSI